ncbi:F-box/FBD/LRR-repeat protein At1g13570-like [Lycium barbarum]|uniref:F-box/FBD/LRR-repeat protein At1g13570-like n=1 Tax=Lycium barbarum TaxID=112863 RepID=UPI00293E6855|nr:F-box/FBD/LRR-repeat protein At1g13570-like [Lycium barbarum]
MMPPRSCQSASLDILSNLQGDVIDEILIRLPLEDAVRTSILSKKWRYDWCRLPELALNQQALKASRNTIPLALTFTNIVNHILTLHSGPITKFTLNLDPYLIPRPTFDNLIYFLSKNDIQHLVLRFPWGINPYKLPSSFFTCLQLRHLTLQSCLIELLPPAFRGFDKLRSLELHCVAISSKLLESLISSCSFLQHLLLQISETSNVVEIKAPKLKSFDFKGNIRFIWLKHIPLLEKVSLTENGSSAEAGNSDIAKFLSLFLLSSISNWIAVVSSYLLWEQVEYQQGFPLISTLSKVITYPIFIWMTWMWSRVLFA